MIVSKQLLGRLPPGQRRPCVHPLATVDRSSVSSTSRQLLDSFWEARGVLDPVHRKRLVDAAEALDTEALRQQPLTTTPLAADAALPGLPATWQLEESTPEVVATSGRLLALQQMLGGGLGPMEGAASGTLGRVAASGGEGSGDGTGRFIDVVWMVVREPCLLSADLTQLTGRLLEMKIATYGTDVDVLKVIEAQPALLLNERWRLDLESLQDGSSSSSSSSLASAKSAAEWQPPPPRPPASSLHSYSSGDIMPPPSSSASDSHLRSRAHTDAAAQRSEGPTSRIPETSSGRDASNRDADENVVRQLVQAWQYGIASDGDQEWASRLEQLSAYVGRHGDTYVGFRDGDDRELSRWAEKQRADWRRGNLAPERLHHLTALGFQFDAEEAEWCRWYSELSTFKGAQLGHDSSMPLVTGTDMYLINWCSVQRIARRSRVLLESRIKRLDMLGFDWSGADPLS